MKLLRYLLTAFMVVKAFSDALADDIPYRQQRREIFRQLPVNENSIVPGFELLVVLIPPVGID